MEVSAEVEGDTRLLAVAYPQAEGVAQVATRVTVETERPGSAALAVRARVEPEVVAELVVKAQGREGA